MINEAHRLPSAAAARVLEIEAAALLTFAGSVPADFDAAIRAVLDMKGRLIVSGIGKSGHIGRKIAATLASTGTPSYFVHPAEASHGDLGMISSDDVCLLLSNSGETSELSDILTYSARFMIPTIGVSSKADSTLMKAATYRLTLPKAPEACPNGMAPTTSTTLTLALGDALAVALMEARGFKKEDFRGFHPGGKLGAKMRRVEELMHDATRLPLVHAYTPMVDVLMSMSSKGFGIAAIVDTDGCLGGIITDGDLRRHIGELMTKTASEIATKDPVTVGPDILAAQALALMNERKISALLVINAKRHPVGILHIHDCLRAGVD